MNKSWVVAAIAAEVARSVAMAPSTVAADKADDIISCGEAAGVVISILKSGSHQEAGPVGVAESLRFNILSSRLKHDDCPATPTDSDINDCIDTATGTTVSNDAQVQLERANAFGTCYSKLAR